MVECKPFDNVTTENEISVIKKRKSTSEIIPFYSFFDFQFKFLNYYNKKWAYSNKFLEINPYLSEFEFDILSKIESNTVLLCEIAENKRGAEIGKNDLKNTTTGNPILIGGDVQKYSIEWTAAKIDNNHKEFKRLRDYFNNINLILLRRVSKDLVATISENPVAYSKNLYGLKINELNAKYILALLNSKVLNFYYKKKFSTKKEDVFPEIQTYFVEQLPIPSVPLYAQQPIISLVEQILSIKQGIAGQARNDGGVADTSAQERQIDTLVYKLYELDYEEVKIIEPEFWLSESEYEAIKV
jgi:hypothetical protein